MGRVKVATYSGSLAQWCCGEEGGTANKHHWHVWGVFALNRHTGVATALGSILSPYLLNFYAENIMQNAGLDDAQAGIKTARRNINNLRYADPP